MFEVYTRSLVHPLPCFSFPVGQQLKSLCHRLPVMRSSANVGRAEWPWTETLETMTTSKSSLLKVFLAGICHCVWKRNQHTFLPVRESAALVDTVRPWHEALESGQTQILEDGLYPLAGDSSSAPLFPHLGIGIMIPHSKYWGKE